MIFINILTCVELYQIQSRLFFTVGLTEQQKIEIVDQLKKNSSCKFK